MKREPLFNSDLGEMEDTEPMPQCIGLVECLDDDSYVLLTDLRCLFPALKIWWELVGGWYGLFVKGATSKQQKDIRSTFILWKRD